MRRAGIRRSMLFGIGVPLILTGLAVAWIEYDRTFASERKLLESAIQQEVHSAADEIGMPFERAEGVVHSTVAVLRALHRELGIAPGERPDAAQLERLLSSQLDSEQILYGAAIALDPEEGAGGRSCPYVWRKLVEEPGEGHPSAGRPSPAERRQRRVLATEDLASVPGYDYEKRAWFTGATRRGVWSDPYYDEGGGDVWMTTFSVRFGPQGLPAVAQAMIVPRGGVATGDVAVIDLRRALLRGRTEERTRLMLLGASGAVLAHNVPGLGERGEGAEGPEVPVVRKAVQEFLAGGPEEVSFSADLGSGEEQIHATFARVSSTGWVLIGFFSEGSIGPEVARRIAGSQAVVLAGVGVVVVVLVVVSRRIARPLEAMAESVRALGEGDLGVRAPGTRRSDEVGDLARSFNDAMERLDNALTDRHREALAREAAEGELRAGRAMQAALLPDLDLVPGDERDPLAGADRSRMGLCAVNIPARSIAGDFFDAFVLPDGRVMLVIADVCGKGGAAALMMAVCRTMIRTAAGLGIPPGEVLQQTNLGMLTQGSGGLFTTAWIGAYDPATGGLEWASAGHPPPLLVSPTGAIEEIGDSTGTVLGIARDERWETVRARLAPGSALVAYTDGVTESREGERGDFFGVEGIRASLARVRGATAAEICSVVADAAQEFAGPAGAADDITVLTLVRLSSPG